MDKVCPNILVITICIGLAFSETSFAQPPSTPNLEQATRASDKLGRESDEIGRELLKKPSKPKATIKEEAAPVPSETEKKILVKNIVLTGNESVPSEEFADII